MNRHRRLTLVAATTLAVSALLPAATSVAGPRVTITPVLHGLAAPRGIAFDAHGNMYVAQAGVAGPGSAGMTHTGRVSKYLRGHTMPAWTTSFDSVYLQQDPSAPPDVLGPAGLSAIGCGQPIGPCQVLMISSESTAGLSAASHGAINDPQAGRLYALNARTGRSTVRSDVGDQMYAFTTTHQSLFPPDFPDSNPYDTLVIWDRHLHRLRTFVVDAGANTVSEVMSRGRLRVVAFLPNETTGAHRDATPTCVTQGPDGWLYVGTLDFVSNLFIGLPGGQSHVYRVNPNANFPTVPKVWASGLTTLTSCTFDRAGNFWATEMFFGGTSATPPGDVVTMPFAHPSRQAHYGFGQLPVPGGIAQGPDGAMYITVGSAAPGMAGGVVRLHVG